VGQAPDFGSARSAAFAFSSSAVRSRRV
jgi:hypothetical protein